MSYATSDKRIAALKSERRQLISAKQDLERRIDELCAEVEYNRQTSRSRLERIDQLKNENAKLREQVEYMTPIALYAASEQERDRMRSLGIEVD